MSERGAGVEIAYCLNKEEVAAGDIRDLYVKSGLNRPSEITKVQAMLDHANVKITAWDGDRLVGFLRAFTDYCFDCYLNDLAVDRQYQRQGIGKRLIAELEKLLSPETMILVVSSNAALTYYPSLGFQPFPDPNAATYRLVR